MGKRCLAALFVAAALLALQAVPAVRADADDSLRQMLTESCAYGDQADIAIYQIKQEALDTLYRELRYSGQLPWNIAGYSYVTNNSGNVTAFQPKYYENDRYDYALYEKLVAEAMFTAVKDGMGQAQMALAVHDYLITHCAYDETLERNTGYDLLVNGTTVCAGYAMAYMDIMNRLGMECRFVSSDEMNHAWNLLKVDGQWYHVDLTWDDPSPNSYGNVLHSHFLLTDAQMREQEHYGWETDITCTDTRFADAYWKDISSQICFLDGKTSVTHTQEDWTCYIRMRNEETGALKTLRKIQPQYIDVGGGTCSYSHEGLSLWNGRLYYATMNTVWSMALDGTDVQTVYRYDAQKNGKYIYGCFVEKDTLYLTLADHSFNQESMTVALKESAYHVHSYTQQTLAGSCTQEGRIIHTCACGLRYETDRTRMLEHSYTTQILRKATCVGEGLQRNTCQICGAAEETAYTDPNAHSYAERVLQAPTLMGEGVRRFTCQDCGSIYDITIPATELSDWLMENRFFIIGVAAGVLAVCGAVVLIAVTGSRKRKNKMNI